MFELLFLGLIAIVLFRRRRFYGRGYFGDPFHRPFFYRPHFHHYDEMFGHGPMGGMHDRGPMGGGHGPMGGGPHFH